MVIMEWNIKMMFFIYNVDIYEVQLMEQYIIKGGNPLVGEVEIGGAKNAALAILAAAIMTDETVEIDNLPDVRDINVLLQAIECIGGKVDRVDRHKVRINGSAIGNFTIDYEYIKKIRASYYLIIADSAELVGSHIYLDVVSVGATINIMLAASMAKGNTIIENAAKEPHVVDVANFLNSMGANIKGAGTDVIKIKGVERLHKTEYAIIPDQIEAGTFMFAAAATKGDVTVKNVIPKHLEAISAKLLEIGCQVEEFDDSVRVIANSRLTHTQVKTLPYPGFPTDMQPQMVVILGLSEGTSIVKESIFENRFKYVDELTKMGANIKVESNTAIIDGVSVYTGAQVTAPDLRAGAALVIAGLAAKEITIIDDIMYVERGYEEIEKKLRNLGAMIEKVSSEKEIQKFKLKVS